MDLNLDEKFTLKDIFSWEEIWALIKKLASNRILITLEIIANLISILTFVHTNWDFKIKIVILLFFTTFSIILVVREFWLKWEITLKKILEIRCRKRIEELAQQKGKKFRANIDLEIFPTGEAKKTVEISILPLKPVKYYDIKHYTDPDSPLISTKTEKIRLKNITITPEVLTQKSETIIIRYKFSPPLQANKGWYTFKLPIAIYPKKSFSMNKTEFNKRQVKAIKKIKYEKEEVEIIITPIEEFTLNVFFPEGFHPSDWNKVNEKLPFVSAPSKESEFESDLLYKMESKRHKIIKTYQGQRITLSLNVKYPYIPATYGIMWKPPNNYLIK